MTSKLRVAGASVTHSLLNRFGIPLKDTTSWMVYKGHFNSHSLLSTRESTAMEQKTEDGKLGKNDHRQRRPDDHRPRENLLARQEHLQLVLLVNGLGHVIASLAYAPVANRFGRRGFEGQVGCD